jgi:hypothetical protein
LIQVEGSVEEEAVHHIDSTVQQQQQQEEEKDPFDIPHRFEVEHQALLAGTHISWEWETIGGIKCRLCPETKLKKWEDFKRHCDTTEAHPSKISLCNIRGDFFTRSDSLGRHRKTPPPVASASHLRKPLKSAGRRRRPAKSLR